ncbi:oligosaccharide flippase family protein [Catenovulum sp. 2E275]|uniref:oligosaccharide flippase family protein n=1 Tax=Catenovulum sp. 2E275 TaxID=2980497 RepID=UPI0021D2DEE6|nr:oligosaccharide flippase family protein [Catenovulum sp. 2E275]MCU4675551.1 oligosaccharide flippase family protein [Catenovulum sp. 2E275]
MDKIISSTLISIVGNMVVKALGILSTVIMARILAPEDFGIAALAVVVYEIFLAIGQLGVQQYILKQQNINKDIYNATFTFRLIAMNLMAALLLLISPFVTQYYQKPVIQELFYIYAFCICIASFGNTHFMQYMRDLNYKPVVNAEILAKIIAISANISFAFYFEDFRAIVYGNLVYVFAMTLRTYWRAPDLPKLTTKGLIDNWNFSKWLLFEVFVGNVRAKIDVILAGRIFTPTDMGFYEVSKANGGMLIQELFKPVNNIILTIISDGKNKGSKNDFEKAIIVMSLFLSPIFIGCYYFMDVFVYLLLGQQWLPVLPLFQGFLILTFFTCFTQLIGSTLVANERIKVLTFMNLALTVIIVSVLFITINTDPDIDQYAYVRISLVPFATFISLLVLKKYVIVSLRTSILALFCYLTIAFISVYPYQFIGHNLLNLNSYYTLALTLIFALPTYILLSLISVRLLGNIFPDFIVVRKLGVFLWGKTMGKFKRRKSL